MTEHEADSGRQGESGERHSEMTDVPGFNESGRLRKYRDAPIGTFGRICIVLIGLWMAGASDFSTVFQWLIGVIGIILFLAAVGLIELTMAIWYRARRRFL